MTSAAALFAVIARETPAAEGPQVGDRVHAEGIPYSGSSLPGTVTRTLGPDRSGGFVVAVHFDGDTPGLEFVRTVQGG